VLADALGQVAARQVGHDEDDVVALLDDVEQPHDVGVVEAA